MFHEKKWKIAFFLSRFLPHFWCNHARKVHLLFNFITIIIMYANFGKSSSLLFLSFAILNIFSLSSTYNFWFLWLSLSSFFNCATVPNLNRNFIEICNFGIEHACDSQILWSNSCDYVILNTDRQTLPYDMYRSHTLVVGFHLKSPRKCYKFMNMWQLKG